MNGFSVYFKSSRNDKSTGVWGDELLASGFVDQGFGVYDPQDLKTTKLDVCIHMSNIYPQTCLKDIAKKNVLWIQGWTFENKQIVPLNEIYEKNVKVYDKIITSSRKLAKDYNIPFVLPYTGKEGYRNVETDISHEVSFIGNIIKPYNTIKRYLSEIGAYDYELYGGDFGKIDHETALKVICGSKININFGFNEGIEWDMVIARPLYNSACGAFTLTDKIPYFEDVFDGAMGFTEGGVDTRDKIRFYLDYEDKRKEMAKRAQEIVESLKPANLLEIIGG